MMRFWFIKAIGGPGSLGFLVLGTALGLALFMLSARTRRVGQWILILLPAGYLMLSIPAVAHVIASYSGPEEAEPARHTAGDLFVLDGDNYLARADMAARVLAAGEPDAARTVWVLGGYDLWDALIARGVPEERCAWGGLTDRSTYGQIVQVRELMRASGQRRAVVVASRLQAPRVRGLTGRQGLDVTVVPAALDHEPPTNGARYWLPSLAALALSRDALYERAALFYYHWHSWI